MIIQTMTAVKIDEVLNRAMVLAGGEDRAQIGAIRRT
jgi:hypothetical protein